MKKNLLILLSALAFLPFSANALSSATYNYTYAENSPLESGRWVKVSLDRTGVYEISYDMLRSMGFSDPSKVAVFGNGGMSLPINFINYYGSRLVEDNLKPVSVLHRGDKVYFYANGPEELSFNGGTEPYFTRVSKNIYSDKAFYFLTDSQAPVEIKTGDEAPEASYLESGWDYAYHEEDLIHNTTGFGQVFWESNLLETGTLTFDSGITYGVPNVSSRLQAGIAISENSKGSVDILVNGNGRSFSLTRDGAKIFEFSNPYTRTDADGKATVVIRPSNQVDADVLALDWWVLTYQKSLAKAKGDNAFRQERIAFSSKDDAISFDVPEGSLVWNIDDINNPAMLSVKDGKAYYTRGAGNQMRFIAFDPSKIQNQISSEYVEVPNSNLHALARENIDMIIYAVPDMKPFAEQIAELHRKHDNLDVRVIDPEIVYNEFSSGTPDPMAYRSFAKMLYQNQSHRLKYVLFMGPFYSDVRNIRGAKDRPYGMIGFQQPGVFLDKEAHNVMDFYGYMCDYIPNQSRLDCTPMEVAVGVLPLYNPDQGALLVKKIREYLENKDMSWMVNETMSMSCPGDSNIHDAQASNFHQLIQQYSGALDSRMAHRLIWVDKYGNDISRDLTTRGFNDGKLFSVYYGHAGTADIGGFYTAADMSDLDNRNLGFMLFAGCDLSVPDNGQCGIGEMCVTRARRGLIGSILATRTVMSNYNYDLSISLLRAMYYESYPDKPRVKTPTIGEVYALGKTRTENDSELAYLLMCDPALSFPIALGKMELSLDAEGYRNGDIATVTGKVLSPEGKFLEDYNGNVVVKLMGPSRKIIYRESTSNGQVTQDFMEFDDMRVSAVKGEVRDGVFTVKVPVPAKAENFSTDEADAKVRLYVGAYDDASRLGTSGVIALPILPEGSASLPGVEKDSEAPAVELAYRPELRALEVTASDNVALYPGIGSGAGVSLTLDGEKITLASETDPQTGVPQYRALIPVGRYSAGAHKAVASVADVAGNSSEAKSYDFNIASLAPLKLSSTTRVALDELPLSLSGVTEASDLRVIFVADNDTHIDAGAASAGSFTLDTADIPAGHYRVAVRESGAAGTVVYSNWIDLTILD